MQQCLKAKFRLMFLLHDYEYTSTGSYEDVRAQYSEFCYCFDGLTARV